MHNKIRIKWKEAINYLFPKPLMIDRTYYKGRRHWKESEMEGFAKRLLQVIGWTDKLSENFNHDFGTYGMVFRQTNPQIDGVSLYSFDEGYPTWNFDVYDVTLFKTLLVAAEKERDEVYNIDSNSIDSLGRILCFQGVFTTHDGAAVADSNCFVDESDVPPIDTWFFLKEDYYHQKYNQINQTLFCWIPKSFESAMQNAIDVEMMDSYDWLDEYDPQFYHILKTTFLNR